MFCLALFTCQPLMPFFWQCSRCSGFSTQRACFDGHFFCWPRRFLMWLKLDFIGPHRWHQSSVHSAFSVGPKTRKLYLLGFAATWLYKFRAIQLKRHGSFDRWTLQPIRMIEVKEIALQEAAATPVEAIAIKLWGSTHVISKQLDICLMGHTFTVWCYLF